MKFKKLSLLPKVAIAIVLGVLCGLFFPDWATRIFLTINGLFGNFLSFIVPLLIVGLVAPGIADLGRGAGKLLLITALIAYFFTLFSGFFTLFTCEVIYPFILDTSNQILLDDGSTDALKPYFTIDMPPILSVMSALVAAFTFGLGMSVISSRNLKGVFDDFKEIIVRVIEGVIIPLLPLYIYGIFLNITTSGEVAGVMNVFLKIIVVIFFITIVMLLLQFSVAGFISKQNPLKLLRNMFPAYMTALGTQSSAATIPVTLTQTLKNGVDPNLAGFVVPLCATIHLSGSMMKIVACAVAIVTIGGMNIEFGTFVGFIFMLGIAMIAAPGVPSGAIMAAIGVLQSMLGFDEAAIGLMIALYIAMDSFGTACNVAGDGAIAVIINKIYKKKA